MMKKIFIYKIMVVSIVFSQDWGGQSGSFLRMGMTARSLAMGGGFTAELDQNFPVFHNPAWSAFLKYIRLELLQLRRLTVVAIHCRQLRH